MTLKQVYTIYNTLMKLHRKYAADVNVKRLQEVVSDINELNATINHPMCNDLTGVFYCQCKGGLGLAGEAFIKSLYADLWLFHRKLIEEYPNPKTEPTIQEFWTKANEECRKLAEKYNMEQSGICKQYLIAIMESAERDAVEK